MPSFTIEAPGETNPLTENSLLHALEAASSTVPAQLQSGTKQLQQWERSPGFYKHLQSVYITQSIPEHIRFLAVIFIKNGIDKYWRKNATNAVSADDKAVIRSRLFSSALSESSPRLYVQNALVIAKIVRFEYPADWPDALTQLIDIVKDAARTDNGPVLDRILIVFLYIIKDLSTGRLLRTRQLLQTAAPSLLTTLTDVYLTKFSQWQNSGIPLDERAAASSFLTLRTIRRLLIAGFEFPHREEYIVQLWATTRNHFDALVNLYSAKDTRLYDPQYVIAVEKHVFQLSKIHVSMATSHPASFVLLPGSIELMLLYWNVIQHFAKIRSAKPEDANSIEFEQNETYRALERLALRGILLTHACVRMIFNPVQTFKYKHDQEKAEKKEAESKMRNILFTDDRVRELMLVLVSEFFTYTSVDLLNWSVDAEEWENRTESGSDGYEYSIRLSSERTFLSLIINFKDLLYQPLLDRLAEVARSDNDNVLLKDSVYSALGLSAAVYHERLDFDALLTNTLANEVQLEKAGSNIIRRRIAVVIGQWAPVRLSQANRPLVYQIYQHLLRPSQHNDLVVRITAARWLKDVVDDWEMKVDPFLPFAEDLLLRLIELVEEVEGTETKITLLETLGVIVARLEHHITPFANGIFMLLPKVWAQAEDEALLAQAILTLVGRLVTALGADSAPFHVPLITIIISAVEPNPDTQSYLIEEAMELWHTIIMQSQAPASSELRGLIQHLLPLYELGDNLRKGLEITESYMLLCPEQMLSEGTRGPLFAAMSNLLDKIKPESSGLINNFIENALRTAEKLGGEAAVQAVTADLIRMKFLPQQLDGIHSAYVAHCTTGPHAKHPAVDGVVETDYFSVLARLCLGSTAAFLHAVDVCAPSSNNKNLTSSNTLESKMGWLLEEWFNHLENIGDPSRRKLMCLALTKLLGTNQSFILSNLQLLMTLWTDVVTELRDQADVNRNAPADPVADSLVYDVMARPGDEGLTQPSPEDLRRQQLKAADPVHTIKLAEWIRHHLSAAVQSAGGDTAFQDAWLSSVDRDVARSFSDLGIM